jgi:polygalacturonase
MNRFFPLVCSKLIRLACAALLAGTGLVARAQSSAEIARAEDAPHVAALAAEGVTLATGSTYSYTVDTPEDKGLLSTAPTVKDLLREIISKDGSVQTYRVTGKDGADKNDGELASGDRLVVTSADGKATKTYDLQLKPAALNGSLRLERSSVTVGTTREVTLFFTAGQRSPDATVRIDIPAGIDATMDNTTINVIGRGDVKLRDLPTQSIGRVGSKYSYSKVGEASIAKGPAGALVLTLSHLDLRPANGADIKLVIGGVKLAKPGVYLFAADYSTTQPTALSAASPAAAVLTAVTTISDFQRVLDRGPYRETPTSYTSISFKWTPSTAAPVQLMQSVDDGKTWTRANATIDAAKGTASITGLEADKFHAFRLQSGSDQNPSASNPVAFYSGKLDVKSVGAIGDGQADDTDKINAAIARLAGIGGGTLRFSDGTYNVRTVHLQSNVTLYVDKGATIQAIKGADAPEAAWFSDRKYRSGLSPTDAGPYADPENWLTKQDVGHHYFHNTMFFGERLDNVKIVGNGRITGNGNLVTGDNVMRNPPENRADKMFTLKLCTNLEIGGLRRNEDLWYDEQKDEPCYLTHDGAKISDIDNLLHLDRAGHFVLLATGTDGIDVHDTYIGKHATGSSRDIYDFMACNDVTATNIYCKVTSDDIVKPGSDCSLGFTRPAKHYRVRNIVGDTNCNLFQIGSETADDIMDLCVDNIYVLGGNKAGFSISTNDGAHIKDVYLNSGRTGPLHSRSKMLRTHTPFFISISNRGRILGATVAPFTFDEAGRQHKNELLVTNVNIGVVENIVLNGVDVSEIYAGSSFGGNKSRWTPYDGKQRKAAPIVAGYKLPDPEVVQGGLNFKLPNGEHTGYIRNITFNDIHFVAKGGNPASDANNQPAELGVGQYNASDLKVLPAYGLYVRHVKGITVNNCSFNYEKRDSTPAVMLDDVIGAKFHAIKLVKASDAAAPFKLKGARDVAIDGVTVYDDTWGNAPSELPAGPLAVEPK